MNNVVSNLISSIKKDLNKIDENKSIRLKPKKYADIFVSSYLSEKNMMNYKMHRQYYGKNKWEFSDEDKEEIKNDLNELLNKMENLLFFKINSYKNFLIALFNKLICTITSNNLFKMFDIIETKYLVNCFYGMLSNSFKFYVYENERNVNHILLNLFKLNVSNILLLTLYNYIEKNYQNLLENVNINDYFDIVMNDKVDSINSSKDLILVISTIYKNEVNYNDKLFTLTLKNKKEYKKS